LQKKPKRLKILRIFALLLASRVLFAQTAPVFELKDSFVATDLQGFVSRYDSDKKDSIQSVFSNLNFQLSYEIPSFKADTAFHWFKFQLKSSSKKQLILEYQQIFIDEIAFFVFDQDSLKTAKQSSWKLDFVEKNTPSRYHAFEFEVEKDKTYTVFLRCHNSKTLYSNRVFLSLSESKYFKQAEDLYLLQLSLSVGCLLFVLLLSLGFYTYSRKKIYVFYALYIASISIYLFQVNGVINQFFSPKTSFLSQPEFGSLLVITNLSFHVFYIYEYFKIKQLQKNWLKIAYFLFQILSLIYLVLVITHLQKSLSFSYFYIFFIGVILASIFSSFSANRQSVYLYLAASGPPFITFVFVIFGAIGLTSINTFFYYYAHIPMALEGIGLGLALLYQFNDERKKIETELEKNRVETTQKILLAQEEERQKLALDLHDDLGGSLSVLNRELDDFNEKNGQILTKSVNLTQKIVADLRTVSHHLMPSSFEEKGLVKVVEESIEMANRQSKVYFIFVCNGEEKRHNLDTEINIYRIIKELINNVLKHSEAKQAVVQLIFFDEFLYVSVEDDGKGFDFSSQQSWGIGLNNINLRSQYLKAKLTTESSPSGTLISLEIPYNAYENQNLAG
jgi:signal transduction histidine kinase